MKFSNRVNSFSFSGIRAMFDKASKYDDALYLCLGEPNFSTPEHVSKVAADALMLGNTRYTPNSGDLKLREALAEKLWRENGIKADPEKNIIITVGAVEALFLAVMTFVNPGDEVIFPDPCWPNYVQQILMAGGVPVPAVTREEDGFRMTAEIIEKAITDKTKLIMLNSPCNPTGAILTKQDYEDIAALVRKHKIMILADEAYEKIVFDGARHYSLASFEGMEDYCITINTFSKAYAMTGWRIGYACANEDIIKTFVKIQEPICSCISGALQEGCTYALNNANEDVERMLKQYERNRNIIIDALNSFKGFSCLKPKATFYAFANITKTGKTSQELADEILDELHVVTSPGSAFGGTVGEGYLRFSFAAETDILEKALERLAKRYG